MRPNDSPLTPRVVFVHGAGGGGWEWTVWLRVFAARGLRGCALDLMPAPAGLAATSFSDYREQVVSWCRPESAHDLAPILMVGASLGGLLAMTVAAEVEVRALLLVNPLPPDGLIGGKGRAEKQSDIIPWGRERSLASTRRAMPDADDAARLFAWRRWRDESGLVLGQASQGLAIEPPTCPFLVMSSDGDENVPEAVGRELATRYQADYLCLPNSSHVGPLLGRQAAHIAERAADWLIDSISSR